MCVLGQAYCIKRNGLADSRTRGLGVAYNIHAMTRNGANLLRGLVYCTLYISALTLRYIAGADQSQSHHRSEINIMMHAFTTS